MSKLLTRCCPCAGTQGTRSLDGKLRDFKGGAFTIARKSGCRIVPVTLIGVCACVLVHACVRARSRMCLQTHEPPRSGIDGRQVFVGGRCWRRGRRPGVSRRACGSDGHCDTRDFAGNDRVFPSNALMPITPGRGYRLPSPLLPLPPPEACQLLPSFPPPIPHNADSSPPPVAGSRSEGAWSYHRRAGRVPGAVRARLTSILRHHHRAPPFSLYLSPCLPASLSISPPLSLSPPSLSFSLSRFQRDEDGGTPAHRPRGQD